MNVTWNMWHGCKKISAGCANCYVYRTDSKFDKDSSRISKNKSFNMPVEKYKNGEYKLKAEGGRNCLYLLYERFFS